MAAFLTARGYLASWEPSDDGGYLLHKHNCPYAAISGQHDELCLMDQVLIDTLLEQPCHRIESMANDYRCTYQVGGEASLAEHSQCRNDYDLIYARSERLNSDHIGCACTICAGRCGGR